MSDEKVHQQVSFDNKQSESTCSESNDLSPERAVTNLSLGTYSSIEAKTIKSYPLVILQIFT